MLTSGRRASRAVIQGVVKTLKELLATDPITFNEVARLVHDEDYQVAFPRTLKKLAEVGLLRDGAMSAEVKEVVRCTVSRSGRGWSEVVDPRTGTKLP
jgi:predicted transcriptional regulator